MSELDPSTAVEHSEEGTAGPAGATVVPDPAGAMTASDTLARAASGAFARPPRPAEILALQRAIGNRAVAVLARQTALARQRQSVVDPDEALVPPLPKPERLERVEVTDLKYVCVFAGHDTYGNAAREYAHVVMREHTLIDAPTLEQAVAEIVRDAGKRGTATHIDELVLIAHASDRGFIKIPLVAGAEGTSEAGLAALQRDFDRGSRKQFADNRARLVDMLSSRSSVVVRGCRAGRSPGLVYALTAFFGGQPTVYVAKEYQAFTAVRAGKTDQELAAAYDHLMEQGMPSQSVYEDEDKAAWIRKHVPSGWVPESFFVDDEHVAEVRKAKKGDTSINAFKMFSESENPIADGHWAVGPTDWQDRDFTFQEMTTDAVLAAGRQHLAALRRLEADEPDNWMDIGREAWMVLRAHHEWMGRPEAEQIVPSAPGDPLGGGQVLTMPGMSYDTVLLSAQASRRPDLRAYYKDAFEAVRLEPPLDPVSTETDAEEDLDAKPPEPGQPILYKPKPGSRRRAPKSPIYEFTSDTIHATPDMPETPLVVPQDAHDKAEYAIVVRGEFKRTFEFKYSPPRPIAGGWLLLTKSELVFAGQLDFKGEGKKEILVGALGTRITKPGELTSGAAAKGETTLASGKSDSGFFGKAKGGLEFGGQDKRKTAEGEQSARGLKAELYLSGEVGWGPVSTELKITIFGIDETRSVPDQQSIGSGVFKILAIKWSPLIVSAGPLEVPLTDGTKAVFSGKVSYAFEAEPNWVQILAKVSEMVGRQAVVADGAAVAGGSGAVATGIAALGVGELVIAGGFLAGGAVTVAAYFKAVEEIESLKGLGQASNAGWDDFYAGFLEGLGITTNMNTMHGALYTEGARHAKVILDWRVKAAARSLNDAHPDLKLKFSDDDPEVRDYLKGVIANHQEQWGRACSAAYENAVRTTFYKAWQNQVGATNAEHDDLNARARAGLKNLTPTDQPDYEWFKYL